MMNATKRNAIVAVLVLGAVCAALATLQWQIASQAKLLETQISTLNEQGKQVASLLRLQRIAEATEADRAELQGYFLERESNSIDFLTEVEGLAPQLGVVLETKSLSAAGEWVEADFRITGSRVQTQRFIQVLENIPYLSQITQLTLKSRDGVVWDADVTMRVRVLAYDQ